MFSWRSRMNYTTDWFTLFKKLLCLVDVDAVEYLPDTEFTRKFHD